MTSNFLFEPNMSAKTIRIACEFSAPIEKVWRAFTEPDLIAKWLAPKPFTIETKIMDFTVGGIWLYAMVMPDSSKHWTRIEFTEIENGSAIVQINMFSNEAGDTVEGAPKSITETKFSCTASGGTRVEVIKTFTNEDTVKMFAENGFREGTLAGYNQLDELLASE